VATKPHARSGVHQTACCSVPAFRGPSWQVPVQASHLGKRRPAVHHTTPRTQLSVQGKQASRLFRLKLARCMQPHVGTQILPAEQTPIPGIADLTPALGRTSKSSSHKRCFTFPLFDEHMGIASVSFRRRSPSPTLALHVFTRQLPAPYAALRVEKQTGTAGANHAASGSF
jgi:hypothetical protein